MTATPPTTTNKKILYISLGGAGLLGLTLLGVYLFKTKSKPNEHQNPETMDTHQTPDRPLPARLLRLLLILWLIPPYLILMLYLPFHLKKAIKDMPSVFFSTLFSVLSALPFFPSMEPTGSLELNSPPPLKPKVIRKRYRKTPIKQSPVLKKRN